MKMKWTPKRYFFQIVQNTSYGRGSCTLYISYTSVHMSNHVASHNFLFLEQITIMRGKLLMLLFISLKGTHYLLDCFWGERSQAPWLCAYTNRLYPALNYSPCRSVLKPLGYNSPIPWHHRALESIVTVIVCHAHICFPWATPVRTESRWSDDISCHTWGASVLTYHEQVLLTPSPIFSPLPSNYLTRSNT